MYGLGELQFKPNLGKKLARHHLNKQTGQVVVDCNPSCAEGTGRRIAIQGQCQIKGGRTYVKNN
jgi:hypothetical protein